MRSQRGIKDPLWLLARQWQTGEFEAENGGRAAILSIVARELPIETLRAHATGPRKMPADTPLDFAVEREDDDGCVAGMVERGARIRICGAR